MTDTEAVTQRRSAQCAGRVLLIEPQEQVAYRLVPLLAGQGYTVMTVPHGSAALKLLALLQELGGRPPDVILLDTRCPFVEGWAFVRAYRQTPGPSVPIVALVAEEQAAERAALLDAIHADATLVKPFPLARLLELVSQYACNARRSGGGTRNRRVHSAAGHRLP